MEFTTSDQEHWVARGRGDAARGRNALMWPTRDGVFFDIDPPGDWTPEYAKLAAKAYYDAWISTEPQDESF